MYKQLIAAAALLLLGIGTAAANDPRRAIGVLESQLNRSGAPKVEGRDVLVDAPVPVLFYGNRQVNNSGFAVDEVFKATGAYATVFVKDGNEYVRVSTNVLTQDGRRGVGTRLARNPAYEALQNGQGWCGDIDVLGTAYFACYNPVRDGGGNVIGATYAGFKKK